MCIAERSIVAGAQGSRSLRVRFTLRAFCQLAAIVCVSCMAYRSINVWGWYVGAVLLALHACVASCSRPRLAVLLGLCCVPAYAVGDVIWCGPLTVWHNSRCLELTDDIVDAPAELILQRLGPPSRVSGNPRYDVTYSYYVFPGIKHNCFEVHCSDGLVIARQPFEW